MSQIKLNHTTNIKALDSSWKIIYKFCGIAALSMVLIILIQFAVFIAWPPPLEGSVLDWFALFQDNWLRGLLSFELLMIVYMVLSIPMALALYIALRQVNQSFAAIFMILSLLGVVSFIAARPAFEMLSQSNQYSATTTGEQRAMLLAAGKVMISIFDGTSFQVSYILGSISGLIISVIMLKSNIFSKATAYMRIISSVLDFGLFISMFSVVFLMIWDILIARRLFQLGWHEKNSV